MDLTNDYVIPDEDVYKPKKKKTTDKKEGLENFMETIMKIAIITDTHFGAETIVCSLMNIFISSMKDSFSYLQKHNIKTVLHLGDVLDRRKFVSYRIAKNFREIYITISRLRYRTTRISW